MSFSFTTRAIARIYAQRMRKGGYTAQVHKTGECWTVYLGQDW